MGKRHGHQHKGGHKGGEVEVEAENLMSGKVQGESCRDF